MLFNCESRSIGFYCKHSFILYVLLVIILYSELKYVEPLRILAQSVPHQPLRVHPFVTTRPSRLQLHKCRELHQCIWHMGSNDFSGHFDYDYQNNENLKNANNHVSDTLKPYFKTTQSTEGFAYNSNSVTSCSPRNNVVFSYPVHDGVENYLSLVTTQKYDVTPKSLSPLLKLKQIIANIKSNIASRLINTKKDMFKWTEPSTSAKYGTDWPGTTKVITKELSKEDESKNDININRNKLLLYELMRGLENLERKFYVVTFTKLAKMAAGGPRAENAISFVQSGLFLQLLLLALSVERAADVKAKIDMCIGLQTNVTNTERIQLINDVVSMLPSATHGLIFRWSSHLVLGPKYYVSEKFKNGAAAALRLRVDQFNGTETPEMLSAELNRMVEEDSNGAIHNTFEPEDLSGTVSAIFLTTLYLRSRWRTAPTVLNGSRIFRDFYQDPERTIRMIRVNDMMRYANLTDCDAEALEVFYGKPGLSLLILVPQGSSLRRLAAYVAEVGLADITSRMEMLRVAADLPLYTLRMSLLLPNKLDGMGLSDLLHVDNTTDSELKMSHGLQRLMFWAEAGRTAFKDDGLEWDDPPDMKIVVDRPYLFFVRWHNMTLMNGNFVL